MFIEYFLVIIVYIFFFLCLWIGKKIFIILIIFKIFDILGPPQFLRKAVPLTLITAILFIFSVYILINYYVLDDAILKVIFIGLASLTFPHILLEYLLEKNEK